MAIYSKIVKYLGQLEKLSCEVCLGSLQYSHVVLSLDHIFMPSHPKAARIRVYSCSLSQVARRNVLTRRFELKSPTGVS